MSNSNENTQVTTLGSVKDTSDLIRRALPTLSSALPRHVEPERFAQTMITMVRNTPRLLECTRGSFMLSVIQCATLGLEPALGQAHIIPYRNRSQGIVEANFQPDYKGLVQLALRTGRYDAIEAIPVYAKDEFTYERGLNPTLRHVPSLEPEPGEVTFLYAIAWPKEGQPSWEVMSRAQVEDIRKRSKSSGDGPWVTDWEQMARKTVFRRLTKWLELSPEARIAVEADTMLEAGRRDEAQALLDTLRTQRGVEDIDLDSDFGTGGGGQDNGDQPTDAERQRKEELRRQLKELEEGDAPQAEPQAGAGQQQQQPSDSEDKESQSSPQDQARKQVEMHVDWDENRWLGDLPTTREIGDVVDAITVPEVILHMWERDTRTSTPGVYRRRLEELGHEVPDQAPGSEPDAEQAPQPTQQASGPQPGSQGDLGQAQPDPGPNVEAEEPEEPATGQAQGWGDVGGDDDLGL